jgi:hypothetical protein
MVVGLFTATSQRPIGDPDVLRDHFLHNTKSKQYVIGCAQKVVTLPRVATKPEHPLLRNLTGERT